MPDLLQLGFMCAVTLAAVWLQEARAKDMINQLKLEMNNLTRLVEAGAGLSIGEEATMNELLKQKEDLTAERDAQVSHMHPHEGLNREISVGRRLASCAGDVCIEVPRNSSTNHARGPACHAPH